MPEPTPEIEVDQDRARRLIGASFGDLPLDSLEPLGQGFDNVVWLLNGSLAFRFPRRPAALAGVLREMAVLPELGPRLPVTIPTPALLGAAGLDDAYPWPFYGGPVVPGRESCAAALDDTARTALARPLALALRALHSPEVAAAVTAAGHDLPVDPMGRADMGVRVRRAREALGDVQRLGMWHPNAYVIDLLSAARGLPAPKAVTVVHGDLHLRHILVGDGGDLSGLIDWGDLCLGSPAIDLQILWSFLPPAARPGFVQAYGPIGEENLLRARVLAFNLNAVLAIHARRTNLAALEQDAVASLRRAAAD